MTAARVSGEADTRDACTPLPEWAVLASREVSCDFDGTGTHATVTLDEGSVVVEQAGAVVFETPQSWAVCDMLVYDFDRAGSPEIVSLVWKRGDWGTSHPFWEDHDTDELGQHLFVHGWRNAEMRPLFMGADLGCEIVEMRLDDLGRVVLNQRDGSSSIWEWRTWGFAFVTSILPSPESTEPPKPAQRVTLLAVGDNIAHTSVFENAYVPEQRRFDFSPLYKHVAVRVASYDIAAVCQETPLVHDAAMRSGFPVFATPETMGDALADAGFNVVLSATNHVNDVGEQGLCDTLAFWAREHPEVTVLGIHETPRDVGPRYMDAGGIRVGFVDYTYGLNGRALPPGGDWRVDVLGDDDRLDRDVAQARESSDFAICFLHVGTEYAFAPSAEHRSAVTRAIDAGADAVICTHTHVLGPYGRMRTAAGNEALVFLGLGNFMSHQAKLSCVVGGAAHLTLERDAPESRARVGAYELLPTVCHVDKRAKTRVYFLHDYTDELAKTHFLSTETAPLTLAALRRLASRARDVSGTTQGLL